MERLHYFIRRLLLVIPTFVGITFLCFLLCQFVPGGPVEQAILRMKGSGMGGEAAGQAQSGQSISEEQRKAIEAHFGFDNKTAWQLIRERFPVSLIFGLSGFVLTYVVCVPLGIAKALRHNQPFDVGSSVLVFIGYAVPPFALGMILKMLLCGTVEGLWDFFPVSGFRSDNFAQLSFIGQVKDTLSHMLLPLVCYMIGNFAVLTLLMKNSLLEQVSSDYIRTVLAKGGSTRRAIWGHAVRNSLIPIATGFGGILTILFAGSVIIEQVFEIPGMGRLSLEAIVSRDYPVFMGIVALTSILGLLGNILSDMCYVLIDPRINFQG
jgi:microcin C transport system permease protein